MAEYEYGIGWRDEIHRTGMTEDEAAEWVAEWNEDGGRPGVFHVIRRVLGPWETVSSSVDLSPDHPGGEGE